MTLRRWLLRETLGLRNNSVDIQGGP